MSSGRVLTSLNLKAGDRVVVRSKEEILASLDADGLLDGLPFMPEMLRFCGQEIPIWRRAEKACDTILKTGARRMHGAVHLADARCDGMAHGNCQAECLLFWKEEWLERTDAVPTPPSKVPPVSTDAMEARLHRSTVSGEGENAVYRCQATALREATDPMHWWDVRQYWRDYRCGNVAATTILSAFCVSAYNQMASRLGVSLRPGWFPQLKGKTPSGHLGLQPGELVEVKSKEEIASTLNEHSRNRGLLFDREMLRYCGQKYRVKRRVTQIINERTGQMMRLPNDCIMLEGVVCVGTLSPRRLFCQRAIYAYWREIWLKRVEARDPSSVIPKG